MTFPTLPGPQGRWSSETSALYKFSSFSPPSASPHTNAFVVILCKQYYTVPADPSPNKTQTQIEIRFVYAYYQLECLWSQLDCSTFWVFTRPFMWTPRKYNRTNQIQGTPSCQNSMKQALNNDNTWTPMCVSAHNVNYKLDLQTWRFYI